MKIPQVHRSSYFPASNAGYPPTLPRSSPGFTLIELLSVVAIIGLLVALLLPAISKMRTKGQETACATNLRQIGAACMLYIQDHNGKFPSTRIYYTSGNSSPGVSDYLQDGDRKKVYKCPALQRDAQFDPASLKDTGGCTYTVSLTTSSNADGTSWAQYNLSKIEVPSQTAWIMDGAWNGSSFSSVIGRNQLQYLDRLQYPHNNQENVFFVDGHVEPFKSGNIPTDPSVSFWTGKR